MLLFLISVAYPALGERSSCPVKLFQHSHFQQLHLQEAAVLVTACLRLELRAMNYSNLDQRQPVLLQELIGVFFPKQRLELRPESG